jgi:hypothetical protein
MSRRAAAVAKVAIFPCLSLLAGCEQRRVEPPIAASASEPSPNASVLPAPLAAGPVKAGPRDAGHPLPDASSDVPLPEPPKPLREDEGLPVEAELRAAPGVALEARFRWLDASAPRSPEGSADGLAKARDKTALEVTLELSSLGRMRFALASRAFPFPSGTELRARDDRYGHIVLWPGGDAYTPLPPGTLRAALQETRVDFTPLADPSVALGGSGNLLGLVTQKQRLETSLGKLELEQAQLPAAGSSGALLCRMLVELLAVTPESAACRSEWVPLRGEYAWASGARFELEVTKVSKRTELSVERLSVPPSTAGARRGELPGPPFVALLDERELAELHTRSLPHSERPDASAPKIGLAFQNRSDLPRYLFVDGVPVVWLRAGADWLVTGLKLGRYSVQARDFFGAEATPLKVVELPARFLVGDEPERVAH